MLEKIDDVLILLECFCRKLVAFIGVLEWVSGWASCKEDRIKIEGYWYLLILEVECQRLRDCVEGYWTLD
jgi:hypothetical protein